MRRALLLLVVLTGCAGRSLPFVPAGPTTGAQAFLPPGGCLTSGLRTSAYLPPTNPKPTPKPCGRSIGVQAYLPPGGGTSNPCAPVPPPCR